MYQWTHIELSRQQQNGPKKECMENLQKQNDKEFSEYESNSTTMTVTSNGCEESFAFIKNKLYSSEVNGKFEFAAGETITVDDGHMEDCVNKESFQSTIADKNGHSKYDQFIQRNCDSKIVRSFVETSTQTENNLESVPLKKSPATLSAAPSMLTPPPPPPPPPPLPFIFTNSPDDNTVNDKSSANESSLQQTSHQISHNTSQNVPATTILSSASSFCIPPPPPINGIPGPPPLPLPTGNMWFKSDSKLNSHLGTNPRCVYFSEYVNYRNVAFKESIVIQQCSLRYNLYKIFITYLCVAIHDFGQCNYYLLLYTRL